MCPPALRPAVVILLAMLAAPGTSVLRNVYVINRGYEELAERLNALGAHDRDLPRHLSGPVGRASWLTGPSTRDIPC